MNVDFPNRVGWRVIAKFDWNLKHRMHWRKCHYAVFRWKIWIGLEILTLGITDSKESNKFSASFYCMYFFNTVRHHIIFIFNTKRPISSSFYFLFVFKVLQKGLRVWVKCDYFKALQIEMHVHTQTWTLHLPYTQAGKALRLLEHPQWL